VLVLSAAVLELRESQTTFTHGSKKTGWKRNPRGIVDRGFAAVFEHEHEHEHVPERVDFEFNIFLFFLLAMRALFTVSACAHLFCRSCYIDVFCLLGLFSNLSRIFCQAIAIVLFSCDCSSLG
jgi:hypothetical protein